MSEQVELVGGYFNGRTRSMPRSSNDYVEAVVDRHPQDGIDGTPQQHVIGYERYRRDPANPRRFVYVQPK